MGKKRHIVLATTKSKTKGGEELSMRRVADILASLGHTIEILTIATDEETSSDVNRTEDTNQDYRYVTLTFGGRKALSIKKRWIFEYTLSYFWEKMPDMVVFFFVERVASAVWFAAKEAGVPFIPFLRGSDIEINLFKASERPFLEHILRESDTVLFVSESSYRKGTYLCEDIRNHSHIIQNSFDPSLYDNVPVERPVKEGYTIGFVGDSEEKRNLRTLIKAFRLVCEKEKGKLTLKIAGHLSEQFADQVKKYVNIISTGQIPQPQMLKTIATFDCLVIPSISEGIPNKMLEAMYTGVPIIAADTCGIPEVLEDRKHALLFRPWDTLAICRHLQTLMHDCTLGTNLQRRARALLDERYSVEDERTRWNDVLKEIP